jgi:hypothetical protein
VDPVVSAASVGRGDSVVAGGVLSAAAMVCGRRCGVGKLERKSGWILVL